MTLSQAKQQAAKAGIRWIITGQFIRKMTPLSEFAAGYEDHAGWDFSKHQSGEYYLIAQEGQSWPCR